MTPVPVLANLLVQRESAKEQIARTPALKLAAVLMVFCKTGVTAAYSRKIVGVYCRMGHTLR